jgi:ArsR family transcriptional regulator
MKPRGQDAPTLVEWLAVLADATRLRILRLLEREELGVGEIGKIVQLPQSTVSRHLKLLLEGGWVAKRAAGTASLYRLDAARLEPPAAELWRVTREHAASDRETRDDDARLREVLAERRLDSKAFFGRIGGEWNQVRRELFGEAFTASALLGLIDSSWTVADLGCGTGDAAELLAPHVRRIIAVDREPSMLEAAKKRLASFPNVEFRHGELASLPFRAGEVDAALVFLVMHHVPDPDAAVTEMARILRPGGVLLIVDMTSHQREEYRRTMGHVHLGFDEKDVRRWGRAAGMRDVRYLRLRPHPEGRGPGLFLATMRKA